MIFSIGFLETFRQRVHFMVPVQSYPYSGLGNVGLVGVIVFKRFDYNWEATMKPRVSSAEDEIIASTDLRSPT